MANNGEVLIFDILEDRMIPWEDDFEKLSEKQREFIVGCLLGDGRLECRSLRKTARLRIHHADSQKDYLFWKFNFLKDITSFKPKRHEYLDKRFLTKVVSWYFHTKTLSFLGRIYLLFYKNGKKVLPENLEKLLTPFSLAIWIMDDGCLSKQTLILNTQSFTREEQEKLVEILKRKYFVEVRIHKDRNNFRLYFPKESTKKILSIIRPYLIGSKFIPVVTDS